jgi:hypothetical protein
MEKEREIEKTILIESIDSSSEIYSNELILRAIKITEEQLKIKKQNEIEQEKQ